jgi:hypothetical protein
MQSTVAERMDMLCCISASIKQQNVRSTKFHYSIMAFVSPSQLDEAASFQKTKHCTA